MSLEFKTLRIGYEPISVNLQAPGDSRRFCYYAAKRGIPFEIAKKGEKYDAIVLTLGADISAWRLHRPGSTKIILDMPDAYLAVPRLDPKGLLRGLAKFMVGQNSRLLLNYTRGLQEMCQRADAVVCASGEQAKQVEPFCSNVHAILDFQWAAIRDCKKDYTAGETFHIVWEGLPGNMHFLRGISGVLLDLQRKHKLALHVVTALRYGKYLHGRFIQQRTEVEAQHIFSPIYLYSWNERTISAISSACDLAVIPIPLDDHLCANKPENKLLFFWRLGVPAVVSATPAHLRTMKKCGLSMACQNENEWRATLQQYICDPSARSHAGQRGRAFAEQHHGEDRMLRQWDEVLWSVLGKPTTAEAQLDADASRYAARAVTAN